MRFSPSSEQAAFAETITGLLGTCDVPLAARAWATGDHDPGLRIWSQLADLGVCALLVPEAQGGLGGTVLDMAVAFESLGHAGMPGPWVESVALAPALLACTSHQDILGELASGSSRVTFAIPGQNPYALDARSSDHAFIVDVDPSGAGRLTPGEASDERRSVDPTRKLSVLAKVGDSEPLAGGTVQRGLDLAALACSALLVGTGRRMLHESVLYATQRSQFGRVIGQFQSLKHALAEVRVALDFAWPLIVGAARGIDNHDANACLDVAAAKVAASDTAQRAARTALQVHGAIGYTMECDLSLWLLKSRALLSTWGTPAFHRAQIIRQLSEASECTSV